MVMVINFALLLLLSFLPDSGAKNDPHGLMKIVNSEAYRRLLIEGRFEEYNSAVDSALSKRFSLELNAARGGNAISPSAIRDALTGGTNSDLGSLFSALKGALKVATFVSKLQMLGPVKAMSQALQWVDTGLIRRSGLRSDKIGSFYGIVSHSDRRRIGESDERALQADFRESQNLMNTGFSRVLGLLSELI